MQLAHTVYIIFLAIGAQLPLIGLFILLRKNIQLKKQHAIRDSLVFSLVSYGITMGLFIYWVFIYKI